MSHDSEKHFSTIHPESKNLAEEIIDAVREPMLLLDKDLRVQRANASFCHHFKVKPEETADQMVYDMGNGQWNIPVLRDLLDNVLPENDVVNDLEIRHTFEVIGPRIILLNARRIDHLQKILLTMEDITDLRQAEERVGSNSRFTEENPFPVLRAGEDGILLYANRAAAALLARWKCRVGGAVPEYVRRELAAALASRTSRELEIRCDGRDLSVVMVPIISRGYVNLYGGDLTERNQAVAALRENEERLRLFIEHAPAGLAMFDRNMRYLCASQRWRHDYGLGDLNLVGVSHYEVFPEICDEWKDAHRRGLDGEVLRAEGDRFERADGSVQWVRWEIRPWTDPAGAIGGIVIFAEDITERKLAEEKLLASEEKFRSIIENLPMGVHMYELDGDGILRFIATNPAADKILGIDNRQFIGQKIEEAFPALLQTEIPDKYRAVATGGGSWFKEESIYRDDRIAGVFEVHCFQFAPGKMVALFQDITSRKQSEEALRQAKEAAEASTRAKGQFLANMSHELRTPMTGVLGMLDLALQGELAGEQRRYLEAVGKSAHALLHILNDILDFSRIEAGMIAFVEEPFPLHEVVREAVELFDIEAQRKGLALILDIASDTPQVMKGDEGRVRQILLNLVGNAVKFTEQGKVVIRVAAGEAAGGRRQIIFTVADTGIGIPEEKRQTLFRPFSQADDSHTRRFGGTGLGLAICKEVVERMGGGISFTSEAKTGSSFVVTLPLRETVAETPAAAVSSAPNQPPPAAEGTKPRLLVAEDDPTIQNVIGLMLRSGGFDFDLAANGEEAVAMWAKGGYDLVLMDVQMPLMDGFEAVRAIREREGPRAGRTPVVALTAHAYLRDRQQCLDAGMDTYIAKPIDFQKLLDVVRELLGGKMKE